jgi:hypothetical protein
VVKESGIVPSRTSMVWSYFITENWDQLCSKTTRSFGAEQK